MKTITSIDALEALYDSAMTLAVEKVADRITPAYRQWIDASRFLVLSTIGPEGTDGTPRGDDGPVVQIADDKTLLLPDWRGNNRLDSLRNIVRDGRVSLMFMVPGCNNVVRLNGTAVLTDDPAITTSFAQKGKNPKTVIVVTVSEIYYQCAKAIMRSGLWTRGDESAKVPTAGEFLREFREGFGANDAADYDRGYPEYAAPRMW